MLQIKIFRKIWSEAQEVGVIETRKKMGERGLDFDGKVYTVNDMLDNLEDEVNKFFQEHPATEVRLIENSLASTTSDGFALLVGMIVVTYKDKEHRRKRVPKK